MSRQVRGRLPMSAAGANFLQCMACLALVAGANGDDVASAAVVTMPPFVDGDRVCFVGDSITKGGDFHAFIELFYATRCADRAIAWYNCGVGGDRAKAMMQVARYRIETDVLTHRPTVVVVMLGMNDVDRNAYALTPGAPATDRQRQGMQDYETGMIALIAALRADGARAILLTPSPYDETAAIPQRETIVGVDGALARCSVLVTGWSASLHTGLVDLHGPMTAISRREQARDPRFSLIGAGKDWNDRVHPGPVANLVMAYAFLMAQGLPREVARISIDGRTGSPAAPQRCRIEGATATPTRIAFICKEEGIPFVAPEAARAAMDLVPFLADLDRETLQVANLDEGRWKLSIDDQEIATWTAAQLAVGIELAENTSTPQHQQSRRALQVCIERRRLGEQLRELATLKYGMAKDGLDPGDVQAVARYIDERIAIATRSGGQVPGYLADGRRPLLEPGRWEKQYDALSVAMREACRPVSHRFVLIRETP